MHNELDAILHEINLIEILWQKYLYLNFEIISSSRAKFYQFLLLTLKYAAQIVNFLLIYVAKISYINFDTTC